jgi:multimeric flavodoxin WrbA
MSKELSAVLFNCTLKSGAKPSSTQSLLKKLAEAMGKRSVSSKVIHAVDEHILFGTESDMGKGDGWPAIREKVMAANIIVIGTPIWVAQRCSVCQMVMERFDAMFSETNKDGQLPLYNKVFGVCVVGNEDGAQHVGASLIYNLMQLGATIPPNAEAYWVGKAGGRDDYIDVGQDDEYTNSLVQTMSSNLVHVATMLKERPIPVDGNTAEGQS